MMHRGLVHLPLCNGTSPSLLPITSMLPGRLDELCRIRCADMHLAAEHAVLPRCFLTVRTATHADDAVNADETACCGGGEWCPAPPARTGSGCEAGGGAAAAQAVHGSGSPLDDAALWAALAAGHRAAGHVDRAIQMYQDVISGDGPARLRHAAVQAVVHTPAA